MKKWSNGAKRRRTEIQTAEDGAKDMQAMAAAIGKLPHGLLKKVLTKGIIAILAKYGVVIQ